MAEFSQPSFSAGEISPAAYGRVDLAKYQTALKTCRNFLTRVHGGAVNRPGTEFIGESEPGRFIPFIFNPSQAYALDFQNFKMSIISAGGYVLNGGNQKFITPTPYSLSQLPRLSFAQLRDVMTLTIDDTRPKNLSRLGHANWNFSDMEFEDGPFQDLNSDISLGLLVSAETGNISITASFPAFVAPNVGQLIYIEQMNYGIPWEVGKAVTAGDIRRSEGKYYVALDSGTTGATRPFGEVENVSESDGVIRWQYIHSGFGIAQITQFNSNISIFATVLSRMPAELIAVHSYKWAFGAWGGDQGWPAVVTYFQQRRTFFSTPTFPEKIWMSGTNAYTFFGKSTPIIDDDAVTMQLVSKQVSPVRFAIDLGKLVIFTVSGKWVIPDDDNNPTITPTRRSARPQGALGASNVLPATVEDSILYVVEKGQTVQDLSYQFVSNAYSGKDLSVLSKHLFEKHQIIAAAYQHVPFQVNWLVRDDGVLLGCTYLKEHEVWGWHRHDFTNGFVEDVCVIPEGQEDRVYLKIGRMINGVYKRYTERLASRLYTDIKDAHFVDSGLKFDGRDTGVTVTITPRLLGGGGFGEGGFGEGSFGGDSVISQNYDVVTNIPYFTALQVGDEIHVPYNDRILKFKIISIVSSTAVFTEAPGVMVPIAILNVPISNWVHAKSLVRGFNHLEGQTLSILVDGKVHPHVQVIDGIIDLQYAGGVIIAGLPIEADFETLNLNAPTAGSLLDREKALFAARFMVEESRGIFAGPDANHLDEFVQRENEPYESPVDLKTGLCSIRVDSTWEPGGRVFVRQVDPLPVSILNVMPDVDIGGAR